MRAQRQPIKTTDLLISQSGYAKYVKAPVWRRISTEWVARYNSRLQNGFVVLHLYRHKLDVYAPRRQCDFRFDLFFSFSFPVIFSF